MRIAEQTRDRHRKSTFTAELRLEKIMFGRSDNKLVLGEGKTKVIFEEAAVYLQRKFTGELCCTLVAT